MIYLLEKGEKQELIAGNMFFDNWFSGLSETDKEAHEDDCPRCGYKMKPDRITENENSKDTIMGCDSCGYIEIWQESKEKELLSLI